MGGSHPAKRPRGWKNRAKWPCGKRVRRFWALARRGMKPVTPVTFPRLGDLLRSVNQKHTSDVSGIAKYVDAVRHNAISSLLNLLWTGGPGPGSASVHRKRAPDRTADASRLS